MLKEHERRRYLESLGEEQRKEAEKKLEEQQRRHREHPKVNVPVRMPQGPPPRMSNSDWKGAEVLQLPGTPQAHKCLLSYPATVGAAGRCSFLGFLA